MDSDLISPFLLAFILLLFGSFLAHFSLVEPYHPNTILLKLQKSFQKAEKNRCHNYFVYVTIFAIVLNVAMYFVDVWLIAISREISNVIAWIAFPVLFLLNAVTTYRIVVLIKMRKCYVRIVTSTKALGLSEHIQKLVCGQDVTISQLRDFQLYLSHYCPLCDTEIDLIVNEIKFARLFVSIQNGEFIKDDPPDYLYNTSLGGYIDSKMVSTIKYAYVDGVEKSEIIGMKQQFIDDFFGGIEKCKEDYKGK